MSEKIALVVDDTDANRVFFERLLTQAGFTVKSVARGSDAVEAIAMLDSMGLAIVDMQIPDMSGLELTKRVRQKFADACIVVATMHDELSIMQSAFSKGCDIFLVKPHGTMELFKMMTTTGSAMRDNAPLIIDQWGMRQYVASAS